MNLVPSYHRHSHQHSPHKFPPKKLHLAVLFIPFFTFFEPLNLGLGWGWLLDHMKLFPSWAPQVKRPERVVTGQDPSGVSPAHFGHWNLLFGLKASSLNLMIFAKKTKEIASNFQLTIRYPKKNASKFQLFFSTSFRYHETNLRDVWMMFQYTRTFSDSPRLHRISPVAWLSETHGNGKTLAEEL